MWFLMWTSQIAAMGCRQQICLRGCTSSEASHNDSWDWYAKGDFLWFLPPSPFFMGWISAHYVVDFLYFHLFLRMGRVFETCGRHEPAPVLHPNPFGEHAGLKTIKCTITFHWRHAEGILAAGLCPLPWFCGQLLVKPVVDEIVTGDVVTRLGVPGIQTSICHHL